MVAVRRMRGQKLRPCGRREVGVPRQDGHASQHRGPRGAADRIAPL